jgi:ribonuclease E
VPKPRIGDTRPAPAIPAAPVGFGGASAPREPRTEGKSTTSGAARRRRRRAGQERRAADGAPSASIESTEAHAAAPAEAPLVEAREQPAEKAERPPREPREPRERRARGGRERRSRQREETEGMSVDDIRVGKTRGGKAVGRYMMAVHVREGITQIAILEGRALIEHYVSRPADDATQIDGNIYLGRVQNVLPGMEAAFVDIGTPKNAVLYRGDVRYDRGDLDTADKNSVRIEQLLRPGQVVMCQVTKNPIGTKGARLTQEVSIPGRFVVLVPNSDTYGISKRLPDDERKRLRRILDDIKPENHGLIVRTAAAGVNAEELVADVRLLAEQWADIEAKAKAKAPALLYREPAAALRVIREEFNGSYRSIVIDDFDLYQRMKDYVTDISPSLADRVEYHDPNLEGGLPIFERYHVHEQIHKALDRKVWLPSGGSLIIERTEALTVIDVNTGRNVGSSSLEETVYRNNLEAAEEIARQLRLRDIGGIIVIDFIDMEIKENREDVMRTFRSALARDKTRTQAFEISELGLVEMTRKRISEGLVESLSETCPTCEGRGLLIAHDLF